MNKLEKMNDAELLKLIRQGQAEAGEIIFRRYYSTLVGISRKYLNCQHDAEDIAQEVFLRVLGMNKISRFRGESSLRTWLIRIAINQCYSKQRKRTEKPLRDDPQHLQPVLPAADPDPEELVSGKLRDRVEVEPLRCIFSQQRIGFADCHELDRRDLDHVGIRLCADAVSGKRVFLQSVSA